MINNEFQKIYNQIICQSNDIQFFNTNISNIATLFVLTNRKGKLAKKILKKFSNLNNVKEIITKLKDLDPEDTQDTKDQISTILENMVDDEQYNDFIHAIITVFKKTF